MTLVLDILSWALLAGGSIVIVIGSIGLLRMPDFFTRVHPAGLIDTLGATMIIGGLILQSGATQVSIKLVLILILLFVTGPTATHALAHAALASGLKPWRKPPPEEDR